MTLLKFLAAARSIAGPYVYLLDRLTLGGFAGHRLLERVEVYTDQVYGAYAVLDELGDVVGVLQVREDAAVDPGDGASSPCRPGSPAHQ